MQYRPLGATGIQVSTISFGAGPVSALMTASEPTDGQLATIARAVELGVNWFDTAATYGDGRSEASLGRVLAELQCGDRVHVATKVRIAPDEVHDMHGAILRSFEGSLQRLRRSSVTLLQLHNSITPRRGDLPTSLTPSDVLGPGGVLETFAQLAESGAVRCLGLTGLGDPQSLAEALRSGGFATIQAPYNILNPSAGQMMAPDFTEQNLGNVFALCAALQVGVFAIRVYAGGALAGQPPSQHTLTTKFFPLDLYQRDQARAAALAARLPSGRTLPEVALRFVLAHPAVTSALVGCGSPAEVEQAVRFAELGPLDESELPAV